MNTDLHAKIEHQRALIFVMQLILVGLLVLIFAYAVRIGRLQEVQLGMVNAAHQRHVEIEKLCAAVSDQEHIIRREAPLVRMSWTAGLSALCR